MLFKTPENYFTDIGVYLSQFQKLDMLFQSWSYSPTLIPLMDSHTQYQDLSDISKNFRVIDSNQEVLLIRADSTLFLARMICKHLRPEMLPLRLCYSNSVKRLEESGNSKEIWQNGIELIGVPSIAGDFEIITLVHTALEDIVPNQYCIHIGSRKLIMDGVAKVNPEITREQLSHLFSALIQRDFEEVIQYTSKEFAHTMLKIMEVEEFKENLSQIAQFASTNTIQQYCTLIDALSHIVPHRSIRCDFSELGKHEYYSNIVFSVYVTDQPEPVALGGRYDSLMKHFGLQIPAVGATIFPHMLMPYFLKSEKNHSSNTSSAFSALSEIETPSVQDLLTCAHAQQRNSL